MPHNIRTIRYQEMRPDELAMCVRETPVLFWPLGLLEHHGWHLPVGLDGLKAERICERVAAETGGVLLPTMWWGCSGGHGEFAWTHYQSPEATAAMLDTTLRQLIDFGFQVLVLLAGHYPWQSLLDRCLPPLVEAHPERLFLWGTEMSIAAPEVVLPGDHAAREETSYGLALLPEHVDISALRDAERKRVWPVGGPPPEKDRHPGVEFDARKASFAQMGVDARTATAERGESAVVELVACLVDRIWQHLTGLSGGAE